MSVLQHAWRLFVLPALVVLSGCPSAANVDAAAPGQDGGLWDAGSGDTSSNDMPLSDLSELDTWTGPDGVMGQDLARLAADLGGTDLEGFCAGTAIAGTCLQGFFGPIAKCFLPSGGCSMAESFPAMCEEDIAACWTGGSRYTESDVLNFPDPPCSLDSRWSATWAANSTTCMTGSGNLDCPGCPLRFYSSGKQGVRYWKGFGGWICPDGSSPNLPGPDDFTGGCNALWELLYVDFGACKGAMCSPLPDGGSDGGPDAAWAPDASPKG